MSKLRLLIVDDDALTLRALERIARNDFVVHTSPDIETAFARIEGDPQLVYDVVLCDLHFRSLSGRDLYDRLQRAGSDLTTRFVLLTGIPPVAGDPFAALLGPRYLTKPCAVPVLLSTLLGVARLTRHVAA